MTVATPGVIGPGVAGRTATTICPGPDPSVAAAGMPPSPSDSHAEPDAMVPVGTGQMDWPSIFRAAMKGGAEVYYIEDESADPLGGIPQSIRYLEGMKV